MIKSGSANSKNSLRELTNRFRVGNNKELGPLKWPNRKQKHSALTAEDLPNEILLLIFSYLYPSDLLAIACVSRRWLLLSRDNVLWHKTYNLHISKLRTPQSSSASAAAAPQVLPKGYWKEKCLTRCKQHLNKKIWCLLKKTSSFTGLPAKTEEALKKAGIQWFLGLVDRNGQEKLFACQDVFYFNMTACVRWYSAELPQPNNIKLVRLISGHPAFWLENNKVAEQGSCQKSLLCEHEMKDAKTLAGLSDDTLNIQTLDSDIALATWKAGGGIAFISAAIHFDHLLQRCLLGSRTTPYRIQHSIPPPDDVDTRHGLRGYTCCVELHNQRMSIWVEQFRDLDAVGVLSGGIGFKLIDEHKRFQHSVIRQPLILPWKSEAFKGIVKNACMLDVTLLDYRGVPIWAASSFVTADNSASHAGKSEDYDYDGDLWVIQIEKYPGTLTAKLVWEQRDRCYFVTSLEVCLLSAFVNGWYGTSH